MKGCWKKNHKCSVDARTVFNKEENVGIEELEKEGWKECSYTLILKYEGCSQVLLYAIQQHPHSG